MNIRCKMDKIQASACKGESVGGTAWYSVATRGLVLGGDVGGRVGRMVCCNSYSNC